MARAVNVIAAVLAQNEEPLVCGNGDSASDAPYIAGAQVYEKAPGDPDDCAAPSGKSR